MSDDGSQALRQNLATLLVEIGTAEELIASYTVQVMQAQAAMEGQVKKAKRLIAAITALTGEALVIDLPQIGPLPAPAARVVAENVSGQARSEPPVDPAGTTIIGSGEENHNLGGSKCPACGSMSVMQAMLEGNDGMQYPVQMCHNPRCNSIVSF